MPSLTIACTQIAGRPSATARRKPFANASASCWRQTAASYGSDGHGRSPVIVKAGAGLVSSVIGVAHLGYFALNISRAFACEASVEMSHQELTTEEPRRALLIGRSMAERRALARSVASFAAAADPKCLTA